MATVFEIDCALMSGLAYQANRNKINWLPAPAEWTEFSHVPNSTDPTSMGFEASAFQRGTEIVISFAGTNPKQFEDYLTDAAMALGMERLNTGELTALLPGAMQWIAAAANSLLIEAGYAQLREAATYYLNIKEANPDASISFTGHSLGGGLARCAEMQARSRLTTSKPPADTEFSP